MKKQYTYTLDEDVQEKAKAKGKKEIKPMSAVINRLLEMWIKGEVKL